MPPVGYEGLKHSSHRVQLAHKYFSTRTRRFLTLEPHEAEQRADALAIAMTGGLQLVAITLDASENAQEIFETLNARMTPLQPTDLIKNYLFQRLTKEGQDVESSYMEFWQPFESGFWEEELAQGRIVRQRLSVYFNYWLEMMTLEDIPAKDLFREFKKFCEHRWEGTTLELLKDLADSAEAFETINVAVAGTESIEGIELSVYRFLAMDLSIVWPVVLWLLRHSPKTKDGQEQAKAALRHLESWMVRRVIAGGRSQSYAQTVLRLLKQLGQQPEVSSEETVMEFLRKETAATSYWPNDDEIQNAIRNTAVYKVITQARVRVLLEALEDDARGYTISTARKAPSRVKRRVLQVEHIMPQEWQENWPLSPSGDSEMRDLSVQKLGNLSILPAKFNASVSNGNWDHKKKAFAKHATELLNSAVSQFEGWSEEEIEAGSHRLGQRILAIWPAPTGLADRIATVSDPSVQAIFATITLQDLVEAQLLNVGDELYFRRVSRGDEYRVFITPDFNLETKDGKLFSSLSAAAFQLTGSSFNGWTTWTLSRTGQTLDEKRQEMVQLMSIPAELN